MLNIIGAVIILVAGTLIGFYRAAQYADRPKQIRQLIQSIQRLETEINYGFTPLPKALKRISRSTQGPVSNLFEQAATRLSQNDGLTTKESWQQIMDEEWSSTAMNVTEKEIMLQLGSTLGISDRNDQLKHLRLASNQLQSEEFTAKEEQIRYEKMCKSLGVLSGALIVIIMY